MNLGDHPHVRRCWSMALSYELSRVNYESKLKEKIALNALSMNSVWASDSKANFVFIRPKFSG